jgi:hypothetical protein
MNADTFSVWLRSQGRRVVRTESSYWQGESARAFQAFPYHWTIRPSESELRELLQENAAVSLRYSTPMDAQIGYLSYHAIFEKPSYEINDLGKWARKNVRRGLRNCVVHALSFERLAEEGWELQRDTLDRQSRNPKITLENWQRLCHAAADLPGFEAWGASVQGRLAASVITFLMDDCCYMLYQQCHRDYLAAHVNNALSFTVTQSMVSRPSVHSVFYSLHSLDAPPSMDEFKFRMGYSAKPVRQRVVFHPSLSPLFNPVTHAVVKAAKVFRPGSTVLAKAEGMLRFYLEGKKPLSEQANGVLPLSRPGETDAQELPGELV